MHTQTSICWWDIHASMHGCCCCWDCRAAHSTPFQLQKHGIMYVLTPTSHCYSPFTLMYCCKTLIAPGTNTSCIWLACCAVSDPPSIWNTGVIRSVLAWFSCNSFCRRLFGCFVALIA